MPTQIRQPSVPTFAPTAPDANAPSITPLTLIAVLIVVLHLAAVSAFGQAQVGQAMESVAVEDAGCAAAPKPGERALPYD